MKKALLIIFFVLFLFSQTANAVTRVHLTDGERQTVTSVSTSSTSPAANSLIIVSVTQTATNAVAPTLTGNGLTWVQIGTIFGDVFGNERVTIFRSMSSTTPSSGAITIDFGAESQSRVGWNVEEFGSVITTGLNGVNAVIQSSTASTTVSSAQALTVTLAAFASSSNAAYGTTNDSRDGMTNISPPTGFTEIVDFDIGPVDADIQHESAWFSTASTTLNWTWDGGGPTTYWGLGMGIEIANGTTTPAVAAAIARQRVLAIFDD